MLPIRLLRPLVFQSIHYFGVLGVRGVCIRGHCPFSGHVGDHTGGVQASLLLTNRMLAKLHCEGLAKGTSGKSALCKPYWAPIIPKTQYKQQMTYPGSTTGRGGCKPLGRTETIWGAGKEKPYTGEDFG